MTIEEILALVGAAAVAAGPVGSLLESAGAYAKLPWLVALGQRLEAFGQDWPKLVRGSRATAMLKEMGPPTPKTGAGASPLGLLLLAGALALSPALPACSPASTPEARGAQTVDALRASANAGAAVVGALDTVNAAWMDAVVAAGDPSLAAAAVPAGRKATAAVNAAYAALGKAQAALDGGDGAGARAYLTEALGYADIVLGLLDAGGQGSRVPKGSRDALAFLRGLAARWASGGAS